MSAYRLSVASLLVLLVTPEAMAAKDKAQPKDKERLVDQGLFAITVSGRRAGYESFTMVEIGAEQEIRTTTQISTGRDTTLVKGKLRIDRDGRPVSGDFLWQAPGLKKQMVLSVNGKLPEMKIEAHRSVVYTRPEKPADLFLLNNPVVLTHVVPLCRLAGAKEQVLSAFPAASLKVAAVAKQSFPQTKLGAPALELTNVTADLAQTMRFELLCDGPRLVALRLPVRGLVAVRASYEALAPALAARVRAKPPLPETLVEVDRRIAVPAAAGAPAATLACALVVPKTHAGVQRGKDGKIVPPGDKRTIGGLVYSPEPVDPLPAVLLLGDAGTHDRDGDPVGAGDPKLSLHKRIAIRIGEAGVASLRCDDRGAAAPALAPNTPLDAAASDALALLAKLRQEPAVAADRVALIGHGEGGLVAALTARKDPKLRALALLAMSGRPFDALVVDQLEAGMRRFGYPDDAIKHAVEEERASYAAVRDHKPLPATLTRTERRALSEAAPWIRSHYRHEPAVVIAAVTSLPVLIAQGAADVQASVKDAELLRDALAKAGNTHVTFKTYEKLNHPFGPAPTASLADYLDPRADVDEQPLADLLAFLREALGPSSGSPAKPSVTATTTTTPAAAPK